MVVRWPALVLAVVSTFYWFVDPLVHRTLLVFDLPGPYDLWSSGRSYRAPFWLDPITSWSLPSSSSSYYLFFSFFSLIRLFRTLLSFCMYSMVLELWSASGYMGLEVAMAMGVLG